MMRPLWPRLLPILFVAATGVAVDAADVAPDLSTMIPYGPVAVPNGKQSVIVSDRTVSLLIDALGREADVPTKVRYVRDLGAAPSEAARAALVKILSSNDALLRAQAVHALAAGGAGDRPEITALIADSSSVVRREAAAASSDEGLLLKALADADVDVRRAAMGKSVSAKTDAALGALLPSVSPQEQAIICAALGRRPDTTVSALIEPLLSSPSIVSRIAAIQSLAALGKLSLAQLKPQASHAHPAVREAAMKALPSLPAGDRSTLALAGLTDVDLGVRAAAAASLNPVATGKDVPPLLSQFQANDDALNQATIATLLSLSERDPAARSAIDAAAGQLLTAANPLLKINGSLLLGLLASKTQLQQHISLLADADWSVVKTAAISLGKIGDASAGPALAAAVERALASAADAAAPVATGSSMTLSLARTSAAEQAILTCVRLGYQPILKVVGPTLINKSGPANIRTAGMWALGVFAPPDAAGPIKTLIGRVADAEEMIDVVHEAIKAAGNARLAGLEKSLANLRDTGEWPTRGVASIALDRMKGTQTPLTAPDQNETPQTAIRDLTPAAR